MYFLIIIRSVKKKFKWGGIIRRTIWAWFHSWWDGTAVFKNLHWVFKNLSHSYGGQDPTKYDYIRHSEKVKDFCLRFARNSQHILLRMLWDLHILMWWSKQERRRRRRKCLGTWRKALLPCSKTCIKVVSLTAESQWHFTLQSTWHKTVTWSSQPRVSKPYATKQWHAQTLWGAGAQCKIRALCAVLRPLSGLGVRGIT